MSFTDTMIFKQPFLSKGPETLKAVNMPASLNKSVFMVNLNMLTIKCQVKDIDTDTGIESYVVEFYNSTKEKHIKRVLWH